MIKFGTSLRSVERLPCGWKGDNFSHLLKKRDIFYGNLENIRSLFFSAAFSYFFSEFFPQPPKIIQIIQKQKNSTSCTECGRSHQSLDRFASTKS